MDPSGGSSQNQPNSKKSTRNRRPNWTPEQTTLMLNLMREEQLAFRVAGPGTFTKQFWDKVATLLSSVSLPPRDGTELFGRWKTIKGEFHDYKACVEKTGWGWHPDNYVLLAPDGAWEELKEKKSKLLKFKDKPFVWYEIMNEICGTNIASGYRAFDGKKGRPIEVLVSASDSSDSNHTASQEMNDFNLREFRNTVGVDLNLSFEEIGQDLPMEYSSQPFFGVAVGATSNSGSGSVSGTSSGKRVREASLGSDQDGQERVQSGKKLKGGSSGKKKVENNPIDVLIEESRERRSTFEEMKNMMLEILEGKKAKQVVQKLFKVRKDRDFSMREVLIIQDLLKDDFFKDVFLTLDGADLDQ